MLNISAFLPTPLSPATIVSLFLLLGLSAGGQELLHKRATAKDFPFSVLAPQDWEVFTESEEDPNEVLFLQTSPKSEYEVTVSFAAHPFAGTWEDVVKRHSYHLIVFEDCPVLVDEELKLRGARGHKWVFKAADGEGVTKLYYRLYLLLPPSVGKNRLLVMQGVAPEGRSPEAIPVFNKLARSMAWGLQATASPPE